MKCALCSKNFRRRYCVKGRCPACHRKVCELDCSPGSPWLIVMRPDARTFTVRVPDDPNVRFLYRDDHKNYRVRLGSCWATCRGEWDDAVPLSEARTVFDEALSLGYWPIMLVRSEAHPDFVDPAQTQSAT